MPSFIQTDRCRLSVQTHLPLRGSYASSQRRAARSGLRRAGPEPAWGRGWMQGRLHRGGDFRSRHTRKGIHAPGPSACIDSRPVTLQEKTHHSRLSVPGRAQAVTFAKSHCPQALPSKSAKVKTAGCPQGPPVSGSPSSQFQEGCLPEGKKMKTPDKRLKHFTDSLPRSFSWGWGGRRTKGQANLAEDAHPAGAEPRPSNTFLVLPLDVGSAAGHLPVLLSTEIER